MNCMALECGPDVIIIDCGTNFPGDDYGVDVIHPAFDWLVRERERVRGLVLTHGHEDHIGAIPYLLRHLSVPVWGPRHALALVARRLHEFGVSEGSVSLNELRTGRPHPIASFSIEPIRVAHSIVDATALFIEVGGFRIVHSGDFNLDPSPPDGEPTDLKRLRQLGDEGLDLLLSDSTNADSDAPAGSEAEVGEALEELVSGCRQRVFVALFASNIQRLISLGRIAVRRQRRVCLLGRSLLAHHEVATNLGYLHWPRSLLLSAERARSFPRDQLMVLCSGTQGEPGAATTRLAQGSHRYLDVEPDDLFIFSSRIIPGNERPVVGLMGDLMRRGARVESRWTSQVHTSGHANRHEQRQMLELTRPRAFVPIHGTLHHLRQHAALAREMGVGAVQVIENGQSAVLEKDGLRCGAAVSVGRVHIAYGGQVLAEDTLKVRRELGRGGALSVGVLCDRRWGLNRAPVFQSAGLPGLDNSPSAVAELAECLMQSWGRLCRRSSAELQLDVQRFVRQWVEQRFGAKPFVVVHLMRDERSSDD